MHMLREETLWTRGLGRHNPRPWSEDNSARVPPPDYDNRPTSFGPPEVFAGGYDNMANFELPRKSRKRVYLLCCFVALAIILLIGIVATPTAISLSDDGSTDSQTGTDQETAEFFSCFVLRRDDTTELNNTASSTRIQFEQSFCNNIQTAVNPTTELSCEILSFVGAPTVVVYRLEFLESQAASMRGKIEAAIIEAMSLGQIGDIDINNRTNVAELTDGMTNEGECGLFPSPSSVQSSSGIPIQTTTIEQESSSSSFEAMTSSESESSSSLTHTIPSTIIESEFSSSATLLPSNSNISEEPSSAFLTPSLSMMSIAELETTLMTSFEPSSSINFTTEVIQPSPTTNFPKVNSTSDEMEDTSINPISPSPVVVVTSSCPGHDEGPCDHHHELDFSHHWQCYVWWTLLYEPGLWEQDYMYSFSVEAYEYLCLRKLARVPWLDLERRKPIRRAKNRLANILITGRPRFPLPQPLDLPDCAMDRMLTIQCHIWWAIVADAHVETFFDITLSPLEDFEEACFERTFPRPDEARDILFEIATGSTLNGTHFIPGNDTFGPCGCAGRVPIGRLRRTTRCFSWWTHLYQSGLWDQDMLSSSFVNSYERRCGRLLVDSPFVGIEEIEDVLKARVRFSAERDGQNITALNISTPLDGNVTVCPTTNSTVAPDNPGVENRDHLKNCFIWWHFVYEELWLMNLTSILTPWESWCYTRVIDGSFEIGHHHHDHD